MPPRSDSRSQTSTVSIKLNGTPLGPDVAARVADATIEQDAVLPDTFSIRFHDIQNRSSASAQTLFPLADQDLFQIGKEIEIALGREAAPVPTLSGEITSIELEMRADGVPLLIARGYDKGHRLTRLTQTRTYVNMKVSDMVRQVAGRHGLGSDVQDTQVVFAHTFQDNQTDWEFVRYLARVVGKEVYVRGNSLAFRAPQAAGAALEQEFGRTLRHLRLRMSASTQVSEVEVRGWDPQAKRAVTATATQPGQTVPRDQGRPGGQAADVFGAGRYVLNDGVVQTQQQAAQRAQAIIDEIAAGFIQFDCVCLGDPELRPGRQVRLVGVSNRFNGEYYISAASHQANAERGYLTTVTVCGRHPNSLTALISTNGARPGAPAAARPGIQHPSVVVGIVTNNRDPDMGGRVKVKFPWFDDNLESNWARIASPMAGNGRGFYMLPEVDDEVLVAFEHGDINRPYIVGSLWNGQDRVPRPAAEVVGQDGKVNQRLFVSRSGHTITIDDTANQEHITIVDKTGHNRIKLESPSNKLTVQVDGDMVFEALQGNISVKGRTVAIEGSQSLSVKSASIRAEATQSLSMNGGAMTEIKGALIKLN